jgi:hypothetical protein
MIRVSNRSPCRNRVLRVRTASKQYLAGSGFPTIAPICALLRWRRSRHSDARSNWDLRPADRKNGLGNIDMAKWTFLAPSIVHRSIADEVRTHGCLP